MQKSIVKKITSEKHYKEIMDKIYKLMTKGSNGVTKKELQEIHKLAIIAQNYEMTKFTIEPSETLAGIIEMKMYERKLKQKDLAKELQVSNAKLFLIMSGKQKPDVDFLKAVHNKLEVNADFCLV